MEKYEFTIVVVATVLIVAMLCSLTAYIRYLEYMGC